MIVVDLVNDAVLRQWVQQAAHAVASLGRSPSVEARAHLLARFVALTLGGGEVRVVGRRWLQQQRFSRRVTSRGARPTTFETQPRTTRQCFA